MNRIVSAGILLARIGLSFLLGTMFVLSSAQSQVSQQNSPGNRLLCFPSDESVGVLLVGRLNGPKVSDGFEQHRRIAARGNVELLPLDEFVELQVGTVDDLGFLEKLSPDALQGLSVVGLEIDRENLSFITHLQGLKQISFGTCQFKKETFDEAKILPSLQAISIHSRTALDATFAGWIATLPKLECVGEIPPIAPLDYQKFNDHPSLERTTIHLAKDETQWPFGELRLPALRELIVRCGDNVSAHALDGIASFSKLESLTIYGGTVDGDLMKKIAEIPTIRKVRLQNNNVGYGLLEGLETVKSLERFEFYPDEQNWPDQAVFERKMAGSLLMLPRIKSIPKIQEPSLRTLEKIFRIKTLETLSINGWNSSLPTAKLQELNAMKNLKSLDLQNIPITDDQLVYLAQLDSLEELVLGSTELRGPGLVHLRNLPRLREIVISMQPSTVEPDLSALSHLSRLQNLSVFGFGFQPKHYHALAECTSLREIALNAGEADDDLVVRLARLPNLSRIDLSGNKITDVGARALARNSNLERVQLTGRITRAAVAEFAKLPKLTSIYINSSELDAVDCVDLQFEFPSVSRFKFTQIGK